MPLIQHFRKNHQDKQANIENGSSATSPSLTTTETFPIDPDQNPSVAAAPDENSGDNPRYNQKRTGENENHNNINYSTRASFMNLSPDIMKFLSPKFGSLWYNDVWFYAMSLEPLEVRNDKFRYLAEALVVFGALFLGGWFSIVEYGYMGLQHYKETSNIEEADNLLAKRLFCLLTSLSLYFDAFLTLFSMLLWIFICCFCGKQNPTFVFNARHFVGLCCFLAQGVLFTFSISIVFAIYLNLQDYIIDCCIGLAFPIITFLVGLFLLGEVTVIETPLELAHFPLWFQIMMYPAQTLGRQKRKTLHIAAKERAKFLKQMAIDDGTLFTSCCLRTRSCNRDSNSADQHQSYVKQQQLCSVEKLLHKAATNLGRESDDITSFVKNLRQEWYDDASLLNELDVSTLSKFMPLRLAHETYRILQEEDMDQSTF